MKLLRNPLLITLASLFLILACAVAVSFEHQPKIALGDYNVTGGGTYRLQSSLSSTQTTVTLSSFKEPVSNIPYTMTYLNSTIEYATLEPQSNNREFVSFTGVTQNSDGSATLTGVTRGLSPSYPFTASSTFQLSHSAQSIFILSNPPQLYNQFAVLGNANSFTAINTFASTAPPTYDGGVTATGNQFVSASQLNATAFLGAATATEATLGLTRLATSAQVGVGTASSTSGAPLVIPNKFATTTPGALCTSIWNCIVSAAAGKISQSWLDLTANFVTTGAWTFAASVAKPLTLNSVAYVFPSANSAGVLKNDGAGTLSWGGPSRYVYATTTAISITHNGTAYSTSTPLQFPSGSISASSTIDISFRASCTWSGGFTEQTMVQVQDQNGAVLATSPDFCGANGAGGSNNGWFNFRFTPGLQIYTGTGIRTVTVFALDSSGALPSTMTTTTKLYLVLQGVANAANMVSSLTWATMILNP